MVLGRIRLMEGMAFGGFWAGFGPFWSIFPLFSWFFLSFCVVFLSFAGLSLSGATLEDSRTHICVCVCSVRIGSVLSLFLSFSPFCVSGRDSLLSLIHI